MTIDFADVVPLIIRSLPGFRASEDELRDADLAYIFKMHIVRYLCSEVRSGSVLPLAQFGGLVEQLLTNGDENVLGLAIDILGDICEQPERKEIIQYLGPKAQEISREMCRTPD